jgi:broad specificity phosphatase PhoE
MQEIILVRHGETRFNTEEIFRGTIDVPLSPHGIRQAEALADALRGVSIEAIYASPLTRAVQTATAVARVRNMLVASDPDLTDMHFGPWEGMPLKEVREHYRREFRIWMRTPELLRLRGAERLEGVRRRAVRALRTLSRGHEGTVLVVSHRVVTKLLVLWVLGLGAGEFWSVKQDTACINRFSVSQGRKVLLAMNDTCHLAGLDGGSTRDF